MALQLSAQVEREFRIDSVQAARWYFVTSTIYTDANGDKQVQEYQRFFAVKDSVISYGIRVRAAIRQDSALAQQARVQADSAKARIDAVLNVWDAVGGGGFRSAAPPPEDSPAAIKPRKAKTTTSRKRKKQ